MVWFRPRRVIGSVDCVLHSSVRRASLLKLRSVLHRATISSHAATYSASTACGSAELPPDAGPRDLASGSASPIVARGDHAASLQSTAPSDDQDQAAPLCLGRRGRVAFSAFLAWCCLLLNGTSRHEVSARRAAARNRTLRAIAAAGAARRRGPAGADRRGGAWCVCLYDERVGIRLSNRGGSAAWETATKTEHLQLWSRKSGDPLSNSEK